MVQITDGNKRLSMQFDCHEVTRRLALKLHVRPILLHAPGIVDDRRTRELLMCESILLDTFKYFDEIDLAIVDIGAIKPAVQSTLVNSGYVSATELKSLRRAGAVGDVFSYFLDDEGHVVRTEIYDRFITIGLAQVRQIRTTVGIEAAKRRAVAAAVRGGSSSSTATWRALLAHQSQNSMERGYENRTRRVSEIPCIGATK